MYNKHAFQAEHKGGCGPMGRGKFGGAWGRGKFGGFGNGPMFGRQGGSSQPPINIEETDAAYIISLFAAGLSKEKVSLTIKDDVLTISYPGTESEGNTEAGTQHNYTYQEYNQGAFERSFRLNNKVVTETITASYADGILKVTLPKDPATNQPAQTITVA